MLLTAFLDVHLNTNPFYPGFRPQLAFGKIFGKLHAQIQAGPDLEIRTFTAADGDSNQTELQTRLTGGLKLTEQLSRRNEFQADAFAVSQTGSRDLRNALLKLYEDNASTLTPDPLYVRFYYSHPPASERLARMAAAGGAP